jgi:RNA-directed DNA polymerase
MIPKQLVWEAYRRVKANKGAAGVDRVSMEGFEEDLRGNLYKIWNRMSSGTYFPPPVKAVEIPKSHGGTRILGVPTVADRIAQTVVALRLEARTESIFHPDSYGYRPRKSAHDALARCRQRCWERNWVVDLDIEKFFDSLDHDLVIKAVEANTTGRWVLLYVRRWLKAPLQMPDGTRRERERGTPKVQRFHPCWLTCFCITQWIHGWSGSSRRWNSSVMQMMRCSIARRSIRRVRFAMPLLRGWRVWDCGCIPVKPR